ncbi:BamA/TamA family outer membrane protein [Nodosilinea nodulosa]|uniref:BamA/TamA family outer membrane protein n=1 Tax=Nodosilinea nodulosa TaxID=416001 RepID=UPI000301C424|nr:BamA/TamA family outer membrane protein [Nodosilinea nodulosa]
MLKTSLKTLGAPVYPLLFASASWGQTTAAIAKTSPREPLPPSTQAQDLVVPSSAGHPRGSTSAEPADAALVLNQADVDADPNNFFFGFGLTLPPPTALHGSARPVTVPALSNQAVGISGGIRFGVRNLGGNGQTVSLGLEGGEKTLGFDLDFRQFLADGSGYAVNVANRRGVEPEFDRGSTEVNLPNGRNPFVHRLGGGVEYFRPLAPDINIAVGLSYQRVSVRDSFFTSEIQPVDALGNRLTVSDSGQDDLLTLNLVGVWDRRDDPQFPTRGDRLLVGLDQALPVGNSAIAFSRLSANYTHLMPLNLFGFTAGPRTLVLNVQGGASLGEVPPYEAFSLGGANSVRGYRTGALGSGRSFVQATAEYRFPAFSFTVFDEAIDVGGTLFVDYASDLGSAGGVIGRPAEVRNKPGSGFGYGVGLRALSPFGPIRLEFGLNDAGGAQVSFNVGDRF